MKGPNIAVFSGRVTRWIANRWCRQASAAVGRGPPWHRCVRSVGSSAAAACGSARPGDGPPRLPRAAARRHAGAGGRSCGGSRGSGRARAGAQQQPACGGAADCPAGAERPHCAAGPRHDQGGHGLHQLEAPQGPLRLSPLLRCALCLRAEALGSLRKSCCTHPLRRRANSPCCAHAAWVRTRASVLRRSHRTNFAGSSCDAAGMRLLSARRRPPGMCQRACLTAHLSGCPRGSAQA